VLLSLLAGIAAAAYYFYDPQQLLQWHQRFEEALNSHPFLTYGSAFLLYVAVTGLSLPGAAILSLIYASLFGFLPAIVLISFASTAGATIAFLLSRYLLRDAVQRRFGHRLGQFNDALRREGAYYLFTLRLLPVAPFFLVNLLMGLTPLSVGTFWWVSQLGMLPGTCAYCWAGSRLGIERLAAEGFSGILGWDVLLAFSILGILPLAAKKLLGRRGVKLASGGRQPPGATPASE
jgi:uncharacterized membrane protein YdjX (TVP38/TMEM64 family)